MKRIIHHPKPAEGEKRRWRSLGELEDTPKFREWLGREFPSGASEVEDTESSRRSFMKLMGASTALAGFGVAGCRRPEKYLVPYTKAVEWIIPGKGLYYATAMPGLGGCTPVVATTYEGRPVALKGNALHPTNQIEVDGEAKSSSGTNHFVPAAVLNLYDPDRSREVLAKGQVSTKEALHAGLEAMRTELAAAQGKGLALLVGEGVSPTRDRLLSEISVKFPQAKLFRYEAFNHDNVRAGVKAAFGREDISLVPRLDQATRVLSLDSNFLGLDSVGNAALGFSSGRRADRLVDGEWQQRSTDEMNRLYVVEPAFTVTGSVADHRLRVAGSQVARVAAAVAQQLGVAGVSAEVDERIAAWVKPAVEDLQAAAGKSVVLAGPQQPAEVHALVAAINEKLGAFGKTITVVQSGERAFGSLTELREAVNSGDVTSVISTTPADPVYDAPSNFRWEEVIEKATYVHLGFNRNHTAVLADWHVPGTHFLEEWGDARAADGTYSVIQPMVNPLVGGISEVSLLLKLLQDGPLTEEAAPVSEDVIVAEVKAVPGADYEAVRDTFLNTLTIPGDKETAWNHALRDGFLANSGYAAATVSGSKAQTPELAAAPSGIDALEVRFVPDNRVYDGRYINNGWLQESPDPITKLTWDNAALMSVKTFNDLGLKEDGQRVKMAFNGREGFFPALQAPGHADNCVTLSVGYGQRVCGRVGYGTGFDAFRMRTSVSPYVVSGATLEVLTSDEEVNPALPIANHAPKDGVLVVEKWSELALTQEHNSMEGRGLARDGGLEGYRKDPEFAQTIGMDSHIPENQHFYKPQGRSSTGSVPFNELDPNHQWGMTIDLNTCLGCTSCQVACQAENNIPIVGKDQVLRGREMAWIRMDRYFTDPTLVMESDPTNHQHSDTKSRGVEILNEDALEILPQPVACQQCEAAPCEAVCPVNATVHSDDGLNVMAYNRCIGTRYCANNCPYKARRFNFFDYNKRNPIVTKKIPGLEFNNLYAGPLGETHNEGIGNLQKNPNVTVRMRGVMEKCTYCLQRLAAAKIAKKVEARDSDKIKLGKDAVKTACQESCPVDAIQFGNIKNEEDTVNRFKESPRSYELLKYVNTRPRTSYLARIKNPNLKMPGGVEVGTTSKHIH
ncbi:TAT-variant-translocated molybdopterin oxidoreductase [bacterium]|nr:TAT-variant-translocated molybdopterin oxidoreductase [bacterium]